MGDFEVARTPLLSETVVTSMLESLGAHSIVVPELAEEPGVIVNTDSEPIGSSNTSVILPLCVGPSIRNC